MEVGQMLDELIKREGGYVNHPADKGGATKYGITIATLSNWRKRDVSVAEVEMLTLDEAKTIYTQQYLVETRIIDLPKRLQPVVLDVAVNSGRLRAGMILQQALDNRGWECAIDGIIGHGTIAAAEDAAASTHDADALIDTICNLRVEFYQNLCKQKPRQRVFLKGWLARAESFRP